MSDEGVDRQVIQATPLDRLGGQEEPPVQGGPGSGDCLPGLPVAQYPDLRTDCGENASWTGMRSAHASRRCSIP